MLDKVVEILKTTKEGAERKAGEVGGEVDKVQGVVEGKAKEVRFIFLSRSLERALARTRSPER